MGSITGGLKMNNHKNWPDGATKIVMNEETKLLRFANENGLVYTDYGWVVAGSEYPTTIATREPEPENKGYQLADGSWSSEYKEGDLFEVVNSDAGCYFAKGSVVKYVDMDGSECPGFELLSGFTKSAISCTYEYWGNLKPHTKKQQSAELGANGAPESTKSNNRKHLEFMLACYQRGLSYSDAVDLWELKNT